MNKIKVRFESGTVESVFSLLYDRMRIICNCGDGETRREKNKDDYPDGITRKITFIDNLYMPSPVYLNTLKVFSNSYMMISPGKLHPEEELYELVIGIDGIVFKGWQTKTPFFEVEYLPQWHDIVMKVVAELKDLFGYLTPSDEQPPTIPQPNTTAEIITAQEGRKRGKPGRKHLPEDIEAWEKIYKQNLPCDEVFQEWKTDIRVKARYNDGIRDSEQNAKRQFQKIIQPTWYKTG